MKQFLVVLMLLCPVGLMAQTKNAAKDFPLTVHVISSKWFPMPNEFGPEGSTAIEAKVVIDGVKYELDARPSLRPREGLLKPGDYKARLVKSKRPAPSYQENQSYVLQFPDGKTQRFYLEAVGR